MKVLELKQILDEMEIPVAYHHFPANKKVSLPFIAYQFPNNNPFYADGKNYTDGDFYDLDIRLCTDDKDFDLEQRLEQILKNNEITYYKTETWIDSEEMFEILYECEVYIYEH